MNRRAIIVTALAALLTALPWRVRAADPCAAERRRVETLTRRHAALGCDGPTPPAAQCARNAELLAEANAALAACEAENPA